MNDPHFYARGNMMSLTDFSVEDEPRLASATPEKHSGVAWVVALTIGLIFAWPLLYAAVAHGPMMITRAIGGDAYHYLAIARKAVIFHIYTYDGVHVTNGFHPLWQYSIRAVFSLLHLHTHEAQAIALMVMALSASTLGIVLASLAIIRLTNSYALAFLLVPGLYYLAIGVHVNGNWIWSVLDGMESSLSLLFGSIFFLVLSHHMGEPEDKRFDFLAACRPLGLVLPFIILSRLDDFFLLPALLIAIFLTNNSTREKVVASAWVAVPSGACIICYLIYGKLTAGAAMPLSGGTKAGFVGFLSSYLTIAIHFPPIIDLKTYLTKKPVDGHELFENAYRQVEVLYPYLIASFGIAAAWRYKRRQSEFPVLFALCLYILFKLTYNFLEVNFWSQDDWYYTLIMLTLSVLGAFVLKDAWALLKRIPLARTAILTCYILLMMLSASQYYASIVYRPADNLTLQYWNRKDEIRRQLVAHGVTGIINFDDGVTAFLLDLPNMHGFAFATDREAQQAYKQGRMLSLAYSRGINALAGVGYLSTQSAPVSKDEMSQYLAKAKGIQNDIQNFNFSIAYYDPALKMAFVSFKPKA